MFGGLGAGQAPDGPVLFYAVYIITLYRAASLLFHNQKVVDLRF